nr:glucose dehydrogenase 1 [Geocoris pallidipennis]
MRLLFYFLLCLGRAVNAQLGILNEIQKQYLRQGLPYRENVFLDSKPILEEYDFVVIGSGPGGSAVANRLSEIPEWSVLLLEQGPEPNIYNDIPFINPISILGNFSKFYAVEKTKNACWGLINEQCSWPAGEVVGGATIINAMLYTRGHPTDFDGWAAEGNPGWSYEEVLPYFLKYENIAIPSLKDSPYHGKGGPVQIEWPFLTKITQRFIRACREAGYPLVDYNNPFTMYGISPSQTAMKNGKRVSALSAYLQPAKNRPNLHVTKNTPATKILIDPKTKIVTGVRYRRKGEDRVVYARKEVIVSAGTFNSPKLLMLSGIGRKQHLESLGIPVIQDLPVGDHLQEHLGTPLFSFLINSTESLIFPEIIRQSPSLFLQWWNGKKGLFSSSGAEAIGYIKTKYAKNKSDIELLFAPITPGADGGAALYKTFAMKPELFEDHWGKNLYQHGFSISPMLMYPKSRGKIRLRSKDFDEPPIIDGNFFNDPQDVKVIIAGIREVQRIARTKELQEVGAKLYRKPLKICSQYPFDSDKYWDCAIRAVPIQWHHQCCTCKMGPSPETSVVDARLRVHGVSRLRVVDASVMANIPGPHTMAPSYMIGEKGADLIKEDYLNKL